MEAAGNFLQGAQRLGWPSKLAGYSFAKPFGLCDLHFAPAGLRAILTPVSLSLAISIRASIMSMSSISKTTASTMIIKTKTTGASGEVRNS